MNSGLFMACLSRFQAMSRVKRMNYGLMPLDWPSSLWGRSLQLLSANTAASLGAALKVCEGARKWRCLGWSTPEIDPKVVKSGSKWPVSALKSARNGLFRCEDLDSFDSFTLVFRWGIELLKPLGRERLDVVARPLEQTSLYMGKSEDSGHLLGCMMAAEGLGLWEVALACLETFGAQRNTACYNCLLSACGRAAQSQMLLQLLMEMKGQRPRRYRAIQGHIGPRCGCQVA